MDHKIQRAFKSLSPEDVIKRTYPICNAELDTLQKTISCDRSLAHFDWWIFDLGITWGWPAALMRSHLPLLGARSAAATVQLQSMSPRGWLMSVTEQKDKKQMRFLCAETETGTELLLLQYEVTLWRTKSLSSLLLQAGPPRSERRWWREQFPLGTHPGRLQRFPSHCKISFYITSPLDSSESSVSPDSKISWLYNSRELLLYLPRRYNSSHLPMEKEMHWTVK